MKMAPILKLSFSLVLFLMVGNAIALPLAVTTLAKMLDPYHVSDIGIASIPINGPGSASTTLTFQPETAIQKHKADTVLANVANVNWTLLATGTEGPGLDTYNYSEHKITATLAAGGESHNLISETIIAYCTAPNCGADTFDGSRSGEATINSPNKITTMQLDVDYQANQNNYPVNATGSFNMDVIQDTTFLDNGLAKEKLEEVSSGIETAGNIVNAVAIIAMLKNGGLAVVEGTFAAKAIFVSMMGEVFKKANLPDAIIVGLIMGILGTLTTSMALAGAAIAGGASGAAAIKAALIAAMIGILMAASSAVLSLWAKDPPDFQYNELVNVDFASVPKFELGDSEFDQAAESFVNNHVRSIILDAAALDTYEKYQGALIDGINSGTDTLAFQELQKAHMLWLLDQSSLAAQQVATAADMLEGFTEMSAEPEFLQATRLVKNTLLYGQNQVPEPSTNVLFMFGLVSLCLVSLFGKKRRTNIVW